MRKIVLVLSLIAFLSLTASGQRIVKFNKPAPIGYGIEGFSANPFGSSTGCMIDIPDSACLTIQVYDVDERVIFRSAPVQMLPGAYNVSWDGKDSVGVSFKSGIYVLEVSVVSTNNKEKNRDVTFRGKGRIYLSRD